MTKQSAAQEIMKYSGRVNIFNPYEPQIRERSVRKALEETDKYYAPFLQLLGARWLVAGDRDEERNSKTIANLKDADADLIVTHDWFVGDMKRYDEELERVMN